MNFPTIVYRTPGTHYASSGTYDYKGAADEAELDRALSSGWFRTLPEAMAGEHEYPVDNTAPTREELEAKAAELGIKFDGRTTDKSLAEKIESVISDREQ
jgi:hypothetical protein